MSCVKAGRVINLATHVGTLSVLNLSPERQFFHYAWPCLDNRVGHGQQVSQAHHNELAELARTQNRPRRSVLRYVFPDAYRGIGQAGEKLKVDKWSNIAVERYFLIDHDRHLDAALAKGIPRQAVDLCRVVVGRVISLTPLECQLILSEGYRRRAFNPLGLPFQLGDAVAIHGLAIVDVLKLSNLREAE